MRSLRVPSPPPSSRSPTSPTCKAPILDQCAPLVCRWYAINGMPMVWCWCTPVASRAYLVSRLPPYGVLYLLLCCPLSLTSTHSHLLPSHPLSLSLALARTLSLSFTHSLSLSLPPVCASPPPAVHPGCSPTTPSRAPCRTPLASSPSSGRCECRDRGWHPHSHSAQTQCTHSLCTQTIQAQII